MKTIKQLCRDLRKNQTEAEKALWDLLRNRQLKSFKFLRQHLFVVSSIQGKMKFYIADFYCAEKKLVVEADGPIHLQQKDDDQNRDEVLGLFGVRVLRFTNDRILLQGDAVLQEIFEVLRV